MEPTLYKYLKREYARRLMTQGEVYIGTLSYYRGIEDKTRADVNEGKKDSVTAFPDGAIVTGPEEWRQRLDFLEGSNIRYKSGTVKIEKGTRFVGNQDIPDAYIYCASKVYSRRLMAQFGADSCIEIFDARCFLGAIDKKLSAMELIYSGLSSGRDVEYVGHAVDSKMKISGNWLKDVRFKTEAEFRFTFVPIIKREGKRIDPISQQRDGVKYSSSPMHKTWKWTRNH